MHLVATMHMKFPRVIYSETIQRAISHGLDRALSPPLYQINRLRYRTTPPYSWQIRHGGGYPGGENMGHCHVERVVVQEFPPPQDKTYKSADRAQIAD